MIHTDQQQVVNLQNPANVHISANWLPHHPTMPDASARAAAECLRQTLPGDAPTATQPNDLEQRQGRHDDRAGCKFVPLEKPRPSMYVRWLCCVSSRPVSLRIQWIRRLVAHAKHVTGVEVTLDTPYELGQHGSTRAKFGGGEAYTRESLVGCEVALWC